MNTHYIRFFEQLIEGNKLFIRSLCSCKNKWLHIGDNVYSDYEIPINFGINAYNYKNVSTYTDIVPNSIFESIVLGIQNNYLYNGLNNDYWDLFGVKYASLIYLGFTKWLYDLTKEEDFEVLPKENVHAVIHLAAQIPSYMDEYHPRKYIDD